MKFLDLRTVMFTIYISLSSCIVNEKEKCYHDLYRSDNYISRDTCILIYILEKDKPNSIGIKSNEYKCFEARKAEFECGKKSEVTPAITNN